MATAPFARRNPNHKTRTALAIQNAADIAGKDSTREKNISLMFVTANEKSEPKRETNERKPDCEILVPISIELATKDAAEAASNTAETIICQNVRRRSSFSIRRKILPARYAGGSGDWRRMVSWRSLDIAYNTIPALFWVRGVGDSRIMNQDSGIIAS
jgi:hypothetical protein